VENPPLSDQYTDETAAATRSAQELLGLPETGIADADTWTAVEALSLQLAAEMPNPDRSIGHGPVYPGRAIGAGSVGPDVAQVETWLNGRSCLYCTEGYVTENRCFGPEETAAVRLAQQRAGLLVTGTVDRGTWAALQAQSCPHCSKEE
jgi:peptidoglycan hydrolase-like protein with peptidoglycan-binding domain